MARSESVTHARRSVGDGDPGEGPWWTLKVWPGFLIIYLITQYLPLFCCCSQVNCQETVSVLKEIFTEQMIMFSLTSHLSYFLMKISWNSVTWDWFYTQRKAGCIISVAEFAMFGLSADALTLAFYWVFYLWTLKTALGKWLPTLIRDLKFAHCFTILLYK